jgi:hypothetical protein
VQRAIALSKNLYIWSRRVEEWNTKNLSEGIKSKKEGTMPLSFMFKWTHISLQNEVHEPESGRDKNLASAVAKIISVTAMVYVIHNVLQGKPGRQVCVLKRAILSQNV